MKTAESVGVESPPLDVSRKERGWAVGCHLVGLIGVVWPLPAVGLIATLLFWLICRGAGVFIERHGREAVNFQLSMLIYATVCVLLSLAGVGVVLLLPLAVFQVVCVVIAGVKASDGAAFRYPVSIRFI